MNKVNLGIIGCGGFVRGMHVPNLVRNPRFRVLACCDLDLDAASACQEAVGSGYVTDDVDRLLHDDAIDAVLIGTRHDTHAGLSVRAARAGKHILCEKPMGLNEAQCRQVVRAVGEAGVIYTVGYNRGLSPLVTQARALLAEASGKAMIYHRIQAPFPASHWTHDPAVGGGRFVGEGCHILDLFCELVDAAPIAVYAAGGTFLDPNEVHIPDSAIVTLTFAGGSVATTLIASDGCPAFPKESTEIYARGKAIHIENFFEMTWHGFGDDPGSIQLDAVDKGHRVELDLWADAILEGADPPNGLSNALRAALISFYVDESLATGQPIAISPEAYAL